jgi:uncharacterized protein RhaS with RHS repeats
VETTTSYGYDALGRLVTVSQAWGGGGGGTVVTNYGYDVQDHLSSVTDGEGKVTRYGTSDGDLLLREMSPVTGVVR